MPGPAGINPNEFRVQSQISSPGSDVSQTAKSNTSGFRGLPSYVSPFFGAAFDYFSQLQSQHEQESYNSREARKARDFAAKQASAAQSFNRGEARWAAQWNSPEHQVQQFKVAGLSPALMYGQMSPSTAQAANGSPASGSQAASAAASSSNFAGAVDSSIQARAVASTAALQQTESARNEVESLRVAIDNMSLHQRNLAQYEQLLASGELDKENAERVRQLRDLEAQQLSAAIDNLAATSNKLNKEAYFIENVQTPLVKAQTATEKERPSLLRAQVLTENERPYEIRHHNELMDSQAFYAREQANTLKQKYGVTQSKIDAISDFLDSNGYPRYFVGYAMEFLDDVASKSGSTLVNESLHTLFSWLSGDNWLSFISSRSNTHDIVDSREKISDADRESREKIAAGHDAVSLERVERLIDSGAKSHDSQRRSEFNRYRAEWNMLNASNKKLCAQRAATLESNGVDERDAAEELAYYAHLLYVQQFSNSSGNFWRK